MWNWVRRLLFGRPREVQGARAGHGGEAPCAGRDGPNEKRDAAGAGWDAAEEGEFLTLLDDPGDAVALDDLGPDDRLFLSGVLRLVRERKLEIPVLPQAAIEVSRLLAQGDPPIGRYVEVLEKDPGLSVEVLRTANSAFYGFRRPAKGLREAVVRLGLHPVRGLLVMAHLRSRVLRGGPFQEQAGWLNDLSLALARVFRTLAPDLGMDPDEASTRGLLFHVEHFVILGALGAIQTAARRPLNPSNRALAEAFRRCGTTVRELAAAAWKLPVLRPDPDLDLRLRAVRRAVVRSWLGQPGGEVPGVDPARLSEALARTARPAGAEAATG
ncbi:HDOD domain-containing protein [Deferrisoma camini]|uniref:HDOD domain-containing protein n=1 Tax=Deferrisoma camini TaxID=1035120 RepID=UPI0004AF038F|nr:HDOD domain-containing protein [Deferrisoma camini]